MEKKQIILPSLRYENAPDVDTNLHVSFEEEKSLLRNDDRDIVLDLSEQFATERSACNRYKLYGKMKMVFRNLYLGVSGYDYLKQKLALYTDGSDNCFAGYLPYDEFAFLRTDLYRETTSGVSVSDMSQFTGFNIITSGTTQHQNITALTAPYHNWNVYMSYVYSHDSLYPMEYTLSGITPSPLSFVSGDGIPFRTQQTASKWTLTSPVKHGISQGEYIIINGRYYYVNTVGNETYDSENHVINILKSQLSGVTFNTLVTGKRCIDINDKDNATSLYYVHQHKTLTSIDDYILDKVGFESPIWEDERKLLFQNSAGVNDYLVEQNRMESVLFDFKEPFVLTGITNNFGYTPTELYVSMIFRNGNGFFNYPPKVGYKFNFHDSWIDDSFNGFSSLETNILATPFTKPGFGYTMYSGETIPKGTILNGAFVEYNPKEMKERIISEAFHKIVSNPFVFNHGQESPSTYYGASSTNPIGLYYQPHYRFKIRELSPYVETSDKGAIIDNLPENAVYFPDEKLWRWRDLYDDGYIDPDGFGTDYPYLNDIHYVHKDINFYIRNEQIYLNKADGIISFNQRGDTDICSEKILVPSPNPSISSTPGLSPTPTPSMPPPPTVTPTPSMPPPITPSEQIWYFRLSRCVDATKSWYAISLGNGYLSTGTGVWGATQCDPNSAYVVIDHTQVESDFSGLGYINIGMVTIDSYGSCMGCNSSPIVPPPSPTPAPQTYGVKTDVTYSSSLLACAGGSPTITLYASAAAPPTIGQFLYTNSGLTTPFAGNGNWYHVFSMGTWYAFQIYGSGYLNDVVTC